MKPTPKPEELGVATTNLPVFLKEITGVLEPGSWKPQSLLEWKEVQESSTLLTAWAEQQGHERGLRRMICVWVFVLISLQIVGVFAIVIADAGSKKIDPTLVKFLIPSVLTEVFGMGFVVVKYLFRPSDFNPFNRRKGR
jgi:hypothetical protein